MTESQRNKISKIKKAYMDANKEHGFDLKSLDFYQGQDGIIYMKVHYERTLVNMVDSEIVVSKISKMGTLIPLSWTIPSINEQLNLLKELIKIEI